MDVQIAPDVTVEPDEQVQLSLQTITGGAFGSTIQATANILDDDEPTVSITHTVDSFEGTTNLIPNSLEFDLTRTGNLSTATTVTFTSSGGTAQANDVYYWQAVGQVLVQTPGFGSTPITFAAGEATKSVFVPIQPDSVIEPDETVVGTLSDAVGGRLRDVVGVPRQPVPSHLQRCIGHQYGRSAAEPSTWSRGAGGAQGFSA